MWLSYNVSYNVFYNVEDNVSYDLGTTARAQLAWRCPFGEQSPILAQIMREPVQNENSGGTYININISASRHDRNKIRLSTTIRI